MRLLILFTLLLLNFSGNAQENVVLHVGKYGKQHKVMDKGFNIPMNAYDFKDDPKMYVSSTSKTYNIVGYEIAIVPKGRDMVGPVKINKNNEEEEMEELEKYFEKGTEIHYKNVIVTCEDCDGLRRPLLAEPFVITLE